MVDVLSVIPDKGVAYWADQPAHNLILRRGLVSDIALHSNGDFVLTAGYVSPRDISIANGVIVYRNTVPALSTSMIAMHF